MRGSLWGIGSRRKRCHVENGVRNLFGSIRFSKRFLTLFPFIAEGRARFKDFSVRQEGFFRRIGYNSGDSPHERNLLMATVATPMTTEEMLALPDNGMERLADRRRIEGTSHDGTQSLSQPRDSLCYNGT